MAMSSMEKTEKVEPVNVQFGSCSVKKLEKARVGRGTAEAKAQE